MLTPSVRPVAAGPESLPFLSPFLPLTSVIEKHRLTMSKRPGAVDAEPTGYFMSSRIRIKHPVAATIFQSRKTMMRT